MAKITALPRIPDGEASGTELLPLVKGGKTMAAPVVEIVTPAVKPFADAAALAKDQAADLVRPENIFIDADPAAVEAQLAEGTYFKLVSTLTGIAEVRVRTSGGSSLLYAEATREALRSNDPVKGAALIGLPDGSTAQDAIARKRRTLKQMGVSYASSADQWAKLNAAMTLAAEDGLDLIAEPHSTYLHDGPLVLDGARFDAMGATFGAMNPANCGLKLTGARPELWNLTRTNPAEVRGSGLVHVPLLIQDATDVRIENVHVDGARGAGVVFWHVEGGFVRNVVVRNTMADGIHFSDGCTDIFGYGLRAEDTGDDGISVVSYASQGRICERLYFFGAISKRSAARGITVVGGRRIIHTAPFAQDAQYAGFYIASETSYLSYGVDGVVYRDGVALNCALSDSGTTYAGAQIVGRTGTSTIAATGEAVSNQAIRCGFLGGSVTGNGQAMTEGARIGPNTESCTIKGMAARDLRKSATRVPNAFSINGANASLLDCEADNVGGTFLNLNTAASGIARIEGCRSRSLGADGAITNNVFYLQAASGITSLRLTDHEHDIGAGVAMGVKAGGLASSAVVLQRRLLFNGAAQSDSGSADWSYANNKYAAVLTDRTMRALEGLRLLPTDTLELTLSIRHSGMLRWFMTRASDQNKNAQIQELVYSTLDSSEAPSGAAGVDYVATLTTPSNARFQRNSAAPFGFVHHVGGIGYSFAMAFDSAANTVKITLTPGSGNLDVSVVPSLEYKHA